MFILPIKALVGQFNQTCFYLQIVFILLYFYTYNSYLHYFKWM